MSLRVIAFLIMSAFAAGAAGPRDASWVQVEEAQKKGLPRTALEALQPIIAAALRDRDWAEATKAIGRRIALETQIEGGRSEAAIDRLQLELGRVPEELNPLFHTLLAEALWSYFRQNQWRFVQRTQNAQEPGPDFRTWDLRRLFQEIDRHFALALAGRARLEAIPIGQFDRLLEKGTLPDAERPTLYDFLAREALAFYQAGEQGLARPADAFVPVADSPLLGGVDEFLGWQPVATDTNSPVLNAIHLHQALLLFHQGDTDPTAFIAADLDRLLYARNVAVGTQRDERFLAAARGVSEKWPRHELSARAKYESARLLDEQGNRVEAHRLASQAQGEFPGSIWAKTSRNLLRQIEAPEVRIFTERIWNDPWPAIEVRYRNVSRISFRAIASDWEQFLDRRRPRPERLNPQQRLELLRRAPALEWSTDLPPTPDYQERRHEIPAPPSLAPGFYFLFASERSDFAETDNQVSVAEIWVSEIALVVRPREGRCEGFVLEARSGEPVAGATVEAWRLNNTGDRVAIGALTTDSLGFFSFRTQDGNRGHLIRARKGSQQVALAEDVYGTRGDATPDSWVQTLFFTDRALYRPGQLVQYKGLCIRGDPTRDRYQVQPGREVTVIFRDANGSEITRQKHRANDFGSFAGTVTAPRDRLMGQMSIGVEDEPDRRASIQVEEYKRPRFQVTLDPPRTAPRLADLATVEGRALAYTGAAIDHATVAWRVVRNVRFPPWWEGRRGIWPPNRGESQEIAQGTASTESDGSFRISFKAIPDLVVPESDEPSFHFEVHADVTDGAGETRSADRTVRVGYTALVAALDADEWQVRDRAVEVRTRTTTLDDEPQSAEGTLKVHRLKEPATVQRPWMEEVRHDRNGPGETAKDLSDPMNWDLAEVISQQAVHTATNGVATNRFDLPTGVYRVLLETQDRFGKPVRGRASLRVLEPDAPRLAIKVPHLLAAPKWELEPGEEFMAVWGTGYEQGRAFVEIEHRGQMIERRWTAPGRTQQRLGLPITEAMRGGVTLHLTQVRENRGYLVAREIAVPWNNKAFDLSWESFRSKLEPGQRETWTAIIKPAASKTRPASPTQIVAEMVASLYDASLDSFLPHAWPERFTFWPERHTTAQPRFANAGRWFEGFFGSRDPKWEAVNPTYRAFPVDLQFGTAFQPFMVARTLMRGRPAQDASGFALADGPSVAMAPNVIAGSALPALKLAGPEKAGRDGREPERGAGKGPAGGAASDLNQVAARKNLNETAFFLPQLLSDSNGLVRLVFSLPESLTEWRFLGFAHDRDLRSGLLEGRAVSARDIMVQPNPPRFLREGDELEFTVKVSNRSEVRQEGRVRLQLAYASDGQPADSALGNTTPERDFAIPARESRSFGWRLKVPDGTGFLTFKAVGSAGTHHDGEEGIVPVLSRRVFLTESLPLPIPGPGTRRFSFESLKASARSTTLRAQSLTVQMASQPAWYAVLALPYLMEFPHECAEQVFNRYYANALARHIANGDPRIRRVFDQWRGTAALDSPLSKNEDLKSVILAETPWLQAAQREGGARRQIAMLFEETRLSAELEGALRKLSELQLADGAWPWFPGGPRNDYITLYITAGFGRLRQLGIELPGDSNPARRAFVRLDAWMDERYQRLKELKQLETVSLDSTIALYLYARSFYFKDIALNPAQREAFDFWIRQGREHWLKIERQSQGHLALALARLGEDAHADALGTAQAIARSLKERSVLHEELGRYWREDERSWWWFRAPIETQALMIEVFDRIARDARAADECRVWLLKQKQTQDWKTTKATADAVYALLLGGPGLLTSDALVQVEIGGRAITPDPRSPSPNPGTGPEPGTGFYEVRFGASEITPALGDLMVRKEDPGIAWGSVHFQYFEDLANVRPYQGTPLTLVKKVFLRRNTPRGRELIPVTGPVQVGDELLLRLELRADRDLEFLHLKDQRGSGTEPESVLSRYRFQDGLAYYESTRDTATHFFFDSLPKGTYVFEYPVRIQHRGEYTSGVAEIQCMYAPEFNSHSGSTNLRVD